MKFGKRLPCSSNRNDSVYMELPDSIFFIRQISKITEIFPKMHFVLIFEIAWLGVVITHFKLLESDCNKCRVVHYRHYLQLQVLLTS